MICLSLLTFGLAISLAGQLKLSNLVLLYDNNAVTCDGPLSWINSEDINSKMRSQGWEVIDVEDGRYDVEGIESALRLAKRSSSKPVFINIRTVIGIDTAVAGTYKAHHGSIDSESLRRSKMKANMSPDSTHQVPSGVLDFFREQRTHGIDLQRRWDVMLDLYTSKYPELSRELSRRMAPSHETGLALLSTMDSSRFAGKATREANGIILERLWETVPSLCGGGADLVNSNKISYSESDVFLPAAGYKGRYLRNGIREHAMASVANGMAAYHPGTFLPITATFLMFYLYVSAFGLVVAIGSLLTANCRPPLESVWELSVTFRSFTLRLTTLSVSGNLPRERIKLNKYKRRVKMDRLTNL